MAKDDEKSIDLSVEYIDALKNLLRAKIKMMIELEPEEKEFWGWGLCLVYSANLNEHQFLFGPKGLEPLGFPVGQDVCVLDIDNNSDFDNVIDTSKGRLSISKIKEHMAGVHYYIP